LQSLGWIWVKDLDQPFRLALAEDLTRRSYTLAGSDTAIQVYVYLHSGVPPLENLTDRRSQNLKFCLSNYIL
jgi:hypothetical protein